MSKNVYQILWYERQNILTSKILGDSQTEEESVNMRPRSSWLPLQDIFYLINLGVMCPHYSFFFPLPHPPTTTDYPILKQDY